MRRYNIENRKDAPECMDEPTFDELPFGHMDEVIQSSLT